MQGNDVTRRFVVVFLNISSQIEGYFIKIGHGCVPHSWHIRTWWSMFITPTSY